MRKIDWINLLIGVACIILVLAAFFHLSNEINQLSSQIEKPMSADISEKAAAQIMASDTLNAKTSEQVIILLPVQTASEEPHEPEWVCPLAQREVELIANVAEAESASQSEYGQRLVIDTVLNRLDSAHFPDTVKDVLYQKNQYYPEGHEVYSRTPAEEYLELVYDELKERTNYDVVFFRTEHYHNFGTPLFQEGDHYFSTLS